MTAVRLSVAALQALAALASVYLVALLGAASFRRGRRMKRYASVDAPMRFVVLVPAHNEEDGIRATLAALDRIDYPRERREIVVIADNCSDGTVGIAAASGATVLERTDTRRRGKGHAIAWALERLNERDDAANATLAADAIVVLDADCVPSANMLTAMAERLYDGAAAVQVDYVVANPDASWAAGLRAAGFSLINGVRPRGKEALGLSAGLFGTGMAFRRDLLRRHPWDAFSVAEDIEFHARLVAAGERVAFAPEARVVSAMPASLRAARTQQERWEGGKSAVIRAWAPRLLRDGLRRRDSVRLHAGVELLIPPQSLLIAANLTLAITAAALRAPGWRVLGFAGLGGQLAYVLGGLALLRAPFAVWRSLLFAPMLIAWKLPLLVQAALGRGPREWVRTERNDAARPRQADAPPLASSRLTPSGETNSPSA